MDVHYRNLGPCNLLVLMLTALCFGDAHNGVVLEAGDDLVTVLRTSTYGPELHKRLAHIPSDVLVDVLVNQLADNPAFTELSLRTKAYQILVDRDAQLYPRGQTQLQACLDEPRLRGVCCAGLSRAPENAASNVVRILGEVLREADACNKGSPLVPVVRALASYGPRAHKYLPTLKSLIANRSCSVELRGELLKKLFQNQ